MQHGVFYIVAGALFALYAVDLIFRISVSLWAQSRESRKLGVPYNSSAVKLHTDNKKRRGGIKAASASQGSSLTSSSSAATLDSCSHNGSSSPPGRQNSQEPASKEGSDSPTVSVELSAFDSGGERRLWRAAVAAAGETPAVRPCPVSPAQRAAWLCGRPLQTRPSTCPSSKRPPLRLMATA